jgi:hypothetical protein
VADLATRPVVILGAARSGTNMLRDILTTLPGVHTWPCDEIPYIWRHGNRDHPDDEFDRGMARPAVRAFIRGAFARRAGPDTRLLVEKTCANTLRAGFVDEVLPEARFVVIRRHGPDAVASAMKRWRSGVDLAYSLRKARFVPRGDLPWYVGRYAANRMRRLLSGERRLGVWGPVFAGMRDLPRDIPLAELAARQWCRCVARTDSELAAVDPARIHRLGYEDFVTDPAPALAGLLAFLDLPTDAAVVDAAVAGVRTGSVGRSARSLSDADRTLVEAMTAAVERPA